MATITNPPTIPPDRSFAQRREALRKANDVRGRRAKLKREVKAGSVSVLEVLASPPEWLESAKVMDLLLAVPKYGRVKVDRMLARERVSPSKTVAGLSDRQRAGLQAALTGTPVTRSQRPIAASLNLGGGRPRERLILDTLAPWPALTATEVARRTGLPPLGVIDALDRLAHRGMVWVDRERFPWLYSLPGKGVGR